MGNVVGSISDSQGIFESVDPVEAAPIEQIINVDEDEKANKEYDQSRHSELEEGGRGNDEKEESDTSKDSKKMSCGAENAEEEAEEEKPSRVYERLVKGSCCSFCLTRCPRTCAVITGIILPLVMLTAISLLFGARLSSLEAPGEIESNDFVLESRFYAELQAYLIVNITVVLPRACYALYLYELDEAGPEYAIEALLGPLIERTEPFVPANSSLVGPNAASAFIGENTDLFDPPTLVINSTELYEFMSDCGDQIQPIVTDLLRRNLRNVVEVSTDLSFNWVRCYEGAEGGTRSFRGGELTAEQRSHDGQTSWYEKTWEKDRQRLFREAFSRLINQGVQPIPAFRNASTVAVAGATGGSSCVYNAPAAAWFWFTVQTTVGYGNQAPETTGGRTLVYIVGFICILAFGGILASAGYILSFLFDDFVEKNGMNVLSQPWCASLLWGSTYYAWMVLIGGITILWKKDRLGDSFGMRDAYWFSYISTTTVGLGDFFLEPEGVVGADLFFYPFLFLIGFIFLSAFLGKFSEFVVDKLSFGRKTFIQTLLDKNVKWSETFSRESRDE